MNVSVNVVVPCCVVLATSVVLLIVLLFLVDAVRRDVLHVRVCVCSCRFSKTNLWKERDSVSGQQARRPRRILDQSEKYGKEDHPHRTEPNETEKKLRNDWSYILWSPKCD